MARHIHYFQIQPDETVAQIIERLSALDRGERALLLLPPDAPGLQHKLALTFLLRAASRRAIRIALVTQNPQTLQLAAELKLSTFPTVGAAEAKRWKRGRGRIFIDRADTESNNFSLEERPTPQPPAPQPSNWARARGFLLRGTLTLTLLSLPVLAALWFLPSANITLTPKLTVIEQEIALRVLPERRSVDVESASIPATVFTVEDEVVVSHASSGQSLLPQQLASGVVTFTNRLSREIVIPEGTSLATSTEPKQYFRTTKAVLLPGGFGESVDATIEAQQSSAGEAGNLPAGAIDEVIASFSESVRVINADATGGGNDATFPIVTQSDHAALREEAESKILANTYQKMSNRLEPGQIIILQSLRIIVKEPEEDWLRYSAPLGEIVATVNLSMRAQVQAVAYRRGDAERLALARLAAERPAQHLFLTESARLNCCLVTTAYEDGSYGLTLQARAEYAPELTEDDFRAALAGRDLAAAQRWLAQNAPLDEETLPEIELQPAWFGRLPFWPERIQIATASAALP